MANFGDAIASIESGGRYDALGPVTRTGDRAYGKYQIMGSNVGPWTREVLGRQMTPEEFAKDPQAQDAVFQAKFGSYVQKYGPEGASRAWFAGEGGMNDPNRKDILGTSVAEYSRKFTNATGGTTPMPYGMPKIMGGQGEDPGLPPLLQQEQQGGLQGLFGDPMKMAYMAMIAKGLNPWSELDPQQMLAQAQRQKLAQAQQFYERQKDQRDYGLRERQFLLNEQNIQADNRRNDAKARREEENALLTPLAKDIVQETGLKPGTKEYAAEYRRRKDEERRLSLLEGDMKGFEYAKKYEGFTGTPQEWIRSKRAGAGEYALTPTWGKDKEGNPVILQLGKGGEAIASKLPEGVQVNKGFEKFDAGTHWVMIDNVTRQPVGQPIPKNIEEKAVAEAAGEAKGKAVVALPAAERTSARAIKMLDELEKHPGFNAAVGLVDSRLPAYSSKMADFRERVEQIDAMVFGDAVEVMRGLGALTDKEGPKITAARARLKTAKSEEDFRTALKDVREVFQDGIELMRRKAGASSAPSSGGSMSAPPAAGSVPPPPPGFQLVR